MPQVQEQQKSANNAANAVNNAAATPRNQLAGMDYASQVAAVTPAPEGAAAKGGATAKSAPAPRPPSADAAEKKSEGLGGAEADAAVRFNTAKGLKAEVWAQVASVVGSSSKTNDATLAKAIAAWQQSKGLTADGKVGDISMSWMSMEPAGKGLDAYVKSNNILFVGINPKSKDKEHNQIKSAAGDKGVTAVKGEKQQDTIDANGEKIDLSTKEGVDKFVQSLTKLDSGRQKLLAGFIAGAGARTKDEMAQLAQQFYRAETGTALFTRIVLSGHSTGYYWWGDDNEGLTFPEMAVLSKIFPIATGQVRSVMLSACNTGQMGKLAQYRAIFPNVSDIWAYVGYSPDASGGSLDHIKSWEAASRYGGGPSKLEAARKDVAGRGRKNDKNVAVATYDKEGKESSYKTSSPEAADDYDTLKATVDGQIPTYEAAYTQGIIDKPALNGFYTKLQNLVGNFAGQLADPDKYQKMLERTLVLRHWDNITKNFHTTHGATVKGGYEAAGKPPVTYNGLKRNVALGHIASYPKPGDEAHNLLTEKLKNLDNIPVSWN
ncbi:MAG: hypothetical protein IT385_24055 [Deltaproteobacteria bacterium]|nr:hypothetical protein [Deltaproteobacteria bacterium]